MRDWVSFLLWLFVGAGAVLGLVGIASIGVFVLPATVVVLVAAILYSKGRGAAGLLLGAGLVLLYVAFLHRQGPGEVCASDAVSTTCVDQLNPWPFLAVVAILALLGIGPAGAGASPIRHLRADELLGRPSRGSRTASTGPRRRPSLGSPEPGSYDGIVTSGFARDGRLGRRAGRFGDPT